MPADSLPLKLITGVAGHMRFFTPARSSAGELAEALKLAKQ